MALSNKEQDHISRLSPIAEMLVNLRNDLYLQNYERNGVPQMGASITQEEIDEIPSFVEASLTVADVTEVDYICSQLLALIDGRMANLYTLKSLG